jgi:hypothetical protein
MKHHALLHTFVAASLLVPALIYASCTSTPEAPDGPYLSSCYAAYSNGALYGNCPISGTRQPTDPNTIIKGYDCFWLEKAQLQKIHGNLCASAVVHGGSWVKTCTGARYTLAVQSVLVAECRTNDGSLMTSQIYAKNSDNLINNNVNLEKQ